MRHRRRGWTLAVPLVCLLAGLLLGATRVAAHGGELRASGSTRLLDLVRTAQSDVDAASTRRDRLVAAVVLAQGTVAAVRTQVADTVAGASTLDAAAGLTSVVGPGVRVTLTDASRSSNGRYASDAAPNDLVVHQQDLQSVLNALWAGGADAVMVQDQRVVVTSAPRCIGNTLLLGGRTYSPPYVVGAIGNPDRLLDALAAERGVAIFKQYVARFGLGYTIERSNTMTVPAYNGSIKLSQAQEVPR